MKSIGIIVWIPKYVGQRENRRWPPILGVAGRRAYRQVDPEKAAQWLGLHPCLPATWHQQTQNTSANTTTNKNTDNSTTTLCWDKIYQEYYFPPIQDCLSFSLGTTPLYFSRWAVALHLVVPFSLLGRNWINALLQQLVKFWGRIKYMYFFFGVV